MLQFARGGGAVDGALTPMSSVGGDDDGPGAVHHHMTAVTFMCQRSGQPLKLDPGLRALSRRDVDALADGVPHTKRSALPRPPRPPRHPPEMGGLPPTVSK